MAKLSPIQIFLTGDTEIFLLLSYARGQSDMEIMEKSMGRAVIFDLYETLITENHPEGMLRRRRRASGSV